MGAIMKGIASPTVMNPAASAPTQAPAAALALPRWTVPAADFTAWRTGPVLCRLDDHAVLEFDGPDAVAFLQGQTTADMAAVTEAHWPLGGYCTPKGRLLAIFQAWRAGGAICLALPREISAPVLRRLSMYILRAKVTARDASGQWSLFGLCGADSAACLRRAGVVPAQAPWQAVSLPDGGGVATLAPGSDGAPRFLLALPAATAAAWLTGLGSLPCREPALWWWSRVDAAVPAVLAASSERFVPQTLNLEVLGGVNFRKGCYPGQEIVARSQYLGKLRRRMALAHAPALGPDDDIYVAGKADPVGRLVLAASAPQGGWDLLLECAQSDAAGGAALSAGSPAAPALQLRPLPYELFDPTA
jgi:folate-binding protein YgfZ